MNPLLTPRDVAERLDVHTTTVNRMVQRGDLIGYRVGIQLRIEPASVDAYLEANRITPQDRPATLRRQPPPEAQTYPWLTNAS